MQHEEFEPPEALKDTIKCFWHNTRDSGDQLTRFEVFPDGYAEIIFHFGSNGSVLQDDQQQPLPSPFLIGLLNQPLIFYTKNRLQVIGVRCYPWTVFDLLGLPSEKKHLHLIQHPVAQLQSVLNKLIEVGKTAEALEKLQQYFLYARLNVASDSLLFKAGVAMRKANGTLPVSEVAAAAHATVRTLERNFKHSSGHTVKDVSAVMRFEQVRNQLWIHPDTNLAGLAHELGYTDQSHLSREFKRYSGNTPAAFARSAKKGKLVVNKNFVAFVQD